MSIALTQRVKELEARVAELEQTKGAGNGPFPFEHFGVQFESLEKELEKKIQELENKYRMLNARISRKTKNE